MNDLYQCSVSRCTLFISSLHGLLSEPPKPVRLTDLTALPCCACWLVVATASPPHLLSSHPRTLAPSHPRNALVPESHASVPQCPALGLLPLEERWNFRWLVGQFRSSASRVIHARGTCEHAIRCEHPCDEIASVSGVNEPPANQRARLQPPHDTALQSAESACWVWLWSVTRGLLTVASSPKRGDSELKHDVLQQCLGAC